MNTQTPKHFVMQLGSLAALYVAITSLLALLFSVINLQFPDTASYYWEGESAREVIRVSIATLVVFFPAYLILTRISNHHRTKEAGGKYTLLTRWLVYLSLLVAGAVMLADLVVLINYVLEGEVTKRFLLKVFSLLLVVGATFHYYILDIRGYFTMKKNSALYFSMGAIVVVAAALLYGFSNIETPTVVREMRIDENQVSDLQDIQRKVETYYNTYNALPESLSDAYGTLQQPAAPEEKPAYVYERTDAATYKLCATFTHPSPKGDRLYDPMIDANHNWEHSSGEWCFTRSVEKTDKSVLMR
tara:strand:- start:172 stop:1077 length:906 start_codon:yes stop_codon:yes gene_type:complete